MRKTVSILAVLMAAFLLLIGCQPPASNSNNANKPANATNNASNSNASAATSEEDIKKVMTEIAAGLAKNDADAVGKNYSDDYVLITPQGVAQSKAERLADMRSGNTKFESFAYEDIKVRSYGDTAVAIATVHAKGKTSGNEAAPQMKATLVFRKTPEGWKVVSGQATAVAAAPTGGNTNSNAAANSNASASSNTHANSANASK